MHHLLRPVLAAGIRSFAYHDGDAPVLSGVDLALAPGTLTTVLGASGSGKTTLGRLLAGWLSPGAGGVLAGFLELAGTRLEFDGSAADPRIDPAQWGRQVGFVPQDASAILSTVKATVAEELAFGLENAGMSPADMRATVEHTAGLLGLTALLERDPAWLSGGQLRRWPSAAPSSPVRRCLSWTSRLPRSMPPASAKWRCWCAASPGTEPPSSS
ncbi:ATP-binding cassette domain-containing protein [Arthrobacter nitrophenolicus]|uniref:ATP-binding cassette domain-containing protein n=1 Tax=Arthrobacter nitrophenolicus TaxID=683150 RepID=UPI0003452B47